MLFKIHLTVTYIFIPAIKHVREGGGHLCAGTDRGYPPNEPENHGHSLKAELDHAFHAYAQ